MAKVKVIDVPNQNIYKTFINSLGSMRDERVRHYVAIFVMILGIILTALGRDSTISVVTAASAAYYFGRRDSNIKK